MPCLLRDSENEELYEYGYFTIGGRFCHVSDDIGSLVSLKFLFGLVNQRFSFLYTKYNKGYISVKS